MLADVGKEILSKTSGVPSEAYMVSSRAFDVELSDGKIEKMDVSHLNGIGLRVFSKKRMGFAYTTDFSNRGIELLVDNAMDGARLMLKTL